MTRDVREAVGWFRKAAEQGNAVAQGSLGFCYQNALGVGRDEREAVKWYRKAADQDDPPALVLLAACYENGVGVARDVGEAVRWYRKAADQTVHAETRRKATEALRRLGATPPGREE